MPTPYDALAATAAAAILYVAYSVVSNRLPIRRHTIAGVAARRLSGFVILGLAGVPAGRIILGREPAELGLTLLPPPMTWIWASVAAAVIVPACFLFSMKSANFDVYPEMRAPVWGPGAVAANAFTAVAYIFAYEFLFRGLLLFPSVDAWGSVSAIAINVALYAVAHIPKGMREAVASIPFGIVLCLAAIDTGSVWTPFLIHFVMSQTNDYLAVWANPAMRFARTEAG